LICVLVTRAIAMVEGRTNWLLFAETAPNSRKLALPRLGRISAPRSLAEHRRSPRVSAARHPDEWSQRRKLLLDPDNPVPAITRLRAGGCWAAVGCKLRFHGDKPSERTCPTVINDCHECLELSSAFPEFSAVGARFLQPLAINRIAFDVRVEPTKKRHFMQVGIARVEDSHFAFKTEGRLGGHSPLLGSVTCTNVGDVMSSAGSMDVVAPGGTWPGLRMRMEDWFSGAPQWLAGDRPSALVLLEVDLLRGRLSIRVDKWTEEPAVLSIPGLLLQDGDGEPLSQWRPFVSLTAEGQEAQIVDFHARIDC